MERFFSKWDGFLIVLAALVCAAALLWPRKEGALTAEVYLDGVLIHRIALDEVKEPYEIPLETDPPALLRVETGRICYTEAGCPDALCLHAGWLDRAGETAACLPSRRSVVLSGAERVFPTY